MLTLLTLALVAPVLAAVVGLVAIVIAVGMTLLIAGPSVVARLVSNAD